MKFQLIDRVVERSEDRLVGVKLVSAAEEYLQDHFPTFPVLPGVLMLEAMVQAARELSSDRPDGPLVLGSVRAVKYGQFVQPGSTLVVEVVRKGVGEGGGEEFRGEGTVEVGGERRVAVSGRFTLRPIRVGKADGVR